MPTPDLIQGVPLPTYDDPAAIPDDLANVFYANLSRGVPRFSTTAQRDAAYPSPTDGQHCWIAAENAVHVRSGGVWRVLWRASWERSTVAPTLTGIPAGWTVAVMSCVRTARVCHLVLTVTPSTSPGSGNVANVQVAALPSGFLPAAPSTAVSTEVGGVFWLNAAGVVTLTAIGAATWAAGQESHVALTYPLA